MRSLDTSPEVHEMQLAFIRSLSPGQRLERGMKWSGAVVGLMAEGIRNRHPDYDDEQVRLALVRHRLGDELFRKVCPTAPLLDP